MTAQSASAFVERRSLQLEARNAATTSDNPSLSVVRRAPPEGTERGAVQSVAATALLQSIAPALSVSPVSVASLPPEVARYLRDSTSTATRRAYMGDIADFQQWGGRMPCDAMMLARYVAERAAIHRPSTLARRVVGIGRAHAAYGFADPSKHELVRAVLHGIRREHGTAQRRAEPLLLQELVAVLAVLPQDLRGTRDRALLTLGFAGALRRSEIVQLDVADLIVGSEGFRVHLRRSKTDQERAGRVIAVPYGRTVACPVTAVQSWLTAAGIQEGPVFRAVVWGQVSDRRLSDQSVSVIVKASLAALGKAQSQYSGHSLRAGFVTSAAQAGVGFLMIQQQTGHRSISMLNRYLRASDLFAGNAAGALL